MMDKRFVLVLLILLVSFLFSSCSPSSQDMDVLRTQIADEIYATQTAAITPALIAAPSSTPETIESATLPQEPTESNLILESYPVSPVLGLPEGTDGYPWWNDAIFYEIFVRSFYDSDGDGIGDLNGIIQKLDYLNDGNPETTDDLGITGIWLMPIFPSPSYHGYNVTDYYDINPQYGTMDDFQNLLEEAHNRGIRVIIDLVLNHSSSEHPWFIEAGNTSSPYHDWYIWSDFNPGYTGSWGQQVWFPKNGRYFYSTFSAGMPDLNYTNPEVTAQMKNVIEFWLEDVGVDGFRLDAAKHIIEEGTIQANSASTHAWWEALRPYYKQVNPEAMIVGEIWEETSINAEYLQGDEFDLSFEFWLAGAMVNAANTGQINELNAQIETSYSLIPPNQFASFLTNHDMDRVMSQLFDQDEKAKVAAALLLTGPGVPFLYYGEEIGMQGDQNHEWVRRPMQWSAEPSSGFTSATPWQPLGPGWNTYNVALEAQDPNAILSYYQALIRIRNQHAALRIGELDVLTTTNEAVYSFLRVSEDEAVLVIINVGDQPIEEVWLTKSESHLAGGTYFPVPIFGEGDFEPIEINQSGGLFHLVSLIIQPHALYILQLHNMTP
jgi:glycosidase